MVSTAANTTDPGVRRRSIILKEHNSPAEKHGTDTATVTAWAKEHGDIAQENTPTDSRKEGDAGWIGQRGIWLALGLASILLFAFYKGALEYNPDSIIRHALAKSGSQFSPPGPSWILDQHAHSSRPAMPMFLQWNITSDVRSPDGVTKQVYLVNGQFPGPVVEARPGDVFAVEVTNSLDNEGLSIHFHGLHMNGFNAMDGAIGFTQDPILPGQTFTYRFNISTSQFGTFWYHAHDEVQRADGIFGAFIIHNLDDNNKSSRIPYDEERVLLINDWYHRSAVDAQAWYMRAGSYGMEPIPDSILINGKGNYNCSKAVLARPVKCEAFEYQSLLTEFDASKTYRLRIVNAGMLSGISVSFTGARLTVIEVDGGHKVNPQMAGSVGIIYPGQRIDVTLRWSNSIEKPVMRIVLDDEAYRYVNDALAVTQEFPINVVNDSMASQELERIATDLNLSYLKGQSLQQALQRKADQIIILYVKTLKLSHLSNRPNGFLNRTTWAPQSPPLINLSRSAYNKHQLIPFISLTSPPKTVDIVVNNIDDDSHPFHIHGYDAFVLQSYEGDDRLGSWNPWEEEKPPGDGLDLVTPLMRDTVIVPRRGFVVLRIVADNPGVWMFHCHVLWHQASGMAMGFEMGIE